MSGDQCEKVDQVAAFVQKYALEKSGQIEVLRVARVLFYQSSPN
jgi:hypothetical protein